MAVAVPLRSGADLILEHEAPLVIAGLEHGKTWAALAGFWALALGLGKVKKKGNLSRRRRQPHNQNGAHTA